MKSIFKRSTIGMIVLGLAGSTYASMPNSYNHWSPRLTGVFIGVDGLDLRPQNGDLDYVTVIPNNSISGGSFFTDAVSPSYDWSWRIYGGIKFTDNDDLTLSWMNMNTSDTDSVSPAGAVNGLGFSAPRFLFEENWTSASAKAKFNLEDVYLVWGHTINFNNPWSVRFAAGLDWAKLDSDLTVTGNDISSNEIGVEGFKSVSNLRGIGPRVEMDLTYHLPYNFALFANANAVLFSSTRKISLQGQNNFNNDELEDIAVSSFFPTRHVVVPKFGMRLGASYSYIFGQSGGEGALCTALTVDAGWQVESYIHAIERPEDGFIASSDSTMVQSSSGTFASTKTSNFGDQGLFLGIKLSSNWL